MLYQCVGMRLASRWNCVGLVLIVGLLWPAIVRRLRIDAIVAVLAFQVTVAQRPVLRRLDAERPRLPEQGRANELGAPCARPINSSAAWRPARRPAV